MSRTVKYEDVECIAQSDLAVLVIIEGDEYWIPQSHIDDDSEVWKKGDEGTLVITQYIAEKKGLI